ETALAELAAEDRNLLRMSLVDQLSIDEIGTIFGIHRATAARRLAAVRDQVQERTRKIMVQRLKLGRSELKSILGFIRSHLDLSIQRLLTEEPAVTAERSTPQKKKKKKVSASRGR